MSKIVLGVGASHSTLMNTHWDSAAHPDRAEAFRDALYEARDAVAAAAPDVVVLVGSNHFRGFWLDLLPAFTFGVGECVAMGEAGTPSGPQSVDAPYARALCSAVMADGFDPAFSVRLQIDHGLSHAIQYVLDGVDVPLVPIVVNVFAPPFPSLGRCEGLGRAIAAAVAADGEDRRVAVIASGGLSHQLPFPKWYEPHSADDEFLVEAWTEGRGDWERFNDRRREITLGSPSVIREDFDAEFLAHLETGRLGTYASWSDEEIESRAGNGGQEIRTWMVMAGAAGHAKGRTLTYQPIPEWLTGMGVALVEPEVAA